MSESYCLSRELNRHDKGVAYAQIATCDGRGVAWDDLKCHLWYKNRIMSLTTGRSTSQSLAPGIVTVQGKGDFKDVIKDLEMGDYPVTSE